MAIDSSIYQLAGRGVKSVADYDNEASQAQQNKLSLMMGGMKMDEAKRGIAGENALAQLLAGGKSGADVATGLASQGFGKQSLDYTKQQGEQAKQKAATEKDELANTMQKLALGAQLLDGVTDQPSYDRARAEAQARGLDVSRMIPNYDPAFVAQKRKEGQTMAQQMEQYWKQKGYDTPDANAVLSASTSTANNAATVGASLSNASATREVASATRDAANTKNGNDIEMKLADDYRNQSKLFSESVSAHKQLTATLGSATTSPAATLAAATKFMKILDPGSVVRESELGMALQASGVLDRAQNYVNILQKGKVLTATQAADFKSVSNQMFEAAQQVQQAIDADYTGKANGYKVRPDMIVQDLGQNTKAPGKAPPIKDKAAFDALPSGATFTAPDGSVRRKP